MLKWKIDKEKDQGVRHYGGKKVFKEKVSNKSEVWDFSMNSIQKI